MTDDTPRDPLAAQPLTPTEIAHWRQHCARLRDFGQPDTVTERWLATLDATRPSGAPSAEPFYLPMDCPRCGRRRMEWDGKVLSCEKCGGSSEWGGFDKEHTRPSGDKTLRAALESLVAASRDHFIVTFRYASGRQTDDEMDAATRALLDATEVGAAALATPSSAPDAEGLNAAWAAAEAALPKHWRFAVTPYYPSGWEAEAHDLRYRSGIGKHGTAAFLGDTPQEALADLVAALRDSRS